MGSLGQNIRRARKRLKIAQQDLAQAVQVSSGFLSQVENDKNTPSLVTLRKLANCLGVSVGYLLGEEEEKTRLLVRAGERYHIDNLSGGSRSLEYLTDVDGQTNIEIAIHTLKPLAQSGSPQSAHEGQEVWLVLEGQIQIQVGDFSCVLEKDDCYYVKDCTMIHMFKNISTTEEARLMCVATPPFFYETVSDKR